MTAQTCPHCFAPVRGDGRSTCLCAAVGAEDFDPLHVRPYVSLSDAGETRDGAADAPAGWWEGELPTPPDTPRGLGSPAPAAPPVAPRPGRAGPTSRTVDSSDEPPPAPAGRPAPRKRSLPAVLAAAGAALAAAAVLTGGDALSGGGRDRAAPPDQGTAAPTAAVPTQGGPRPSATGAPAPPPTDRAPSRRAGARPAPGNTLTLHRTPAPRPPSPTRAAGSVGEAPAGQPSAAPTGPIVLREGSSGPEVVELQDRLRQLGGYPGRADGRYGADVRDAVSRFQGAYGVTGDAGGVYGERTRASLESRTEEP